MPEPNTQEQVTQARIQIEQAKDEARRARQANIPTEAQRRSQDGLQALRQRQTQEANITKYERQVNQAERQQEQQIARIAPEQAKPEYLEQSYQEAKTQVQKEAKDIQGQLTDLQSQRQRLEGISGEGDTRNRLDNQIKALSSKLNVYKEELSTDKINLVKDFYSGNYKSKADYAYQVERRTPVKPTQLTGKDIIELAKQNPNLNAGEITDILRKQNVLSTQTGAKPQLEFSYTPSGQLQYSKIEPMTPVTSTTINQGDSFKIAKDILSKPVGSEGMANLIDISTGLTQEEARKLNNPPQVVTMDIRQIPVVAGIISAVTNKPVSSDNPNAILYSALGKTYAEKVINPTNRFLNLATKDIGKNIVQPTAKILSQTTQTVIGTANMFTKDMGKNILQPEVKSALSKTASDVGKAFKETFILQPEVKSALSKTASDVGKAFKETFILQPEVKSALSKTASDVGKAFKETFILQPEVKSALSKTASDVGKAFKETFILQPEVKSALSKTASDVGKAFKETFILQPEVKSALSKTASDVGLDLFTKDLNKNIIKPTIESAKQTVGIVQYLASGTAEEAKDFPFNEISKIGKPTVLDITYGDKPITEINLVPSTSKEFFVETLGGVVKPVREGLVTITPTQFGKEAVGGIIDILTPKSWLDIGMIAGTGLAFKYGLKYLPKLTYTALGGLTGKGAYEYKTAESLQQREQASAQIVMGLVPFGLKGGSKIVKEFGYERFIRPFSKEFKDEISITEMISKNVKNEIPMDIRVPKLGLAKVDNKGYINIPEGGKVKGQAKEIEYYPTGEIQGLVLEKRNIPQTFMEKMKNVFNIEQPKLRNYLGEVKYDTKTGIQIETINYGNVRKVTTFDTNLGKGKIEVFKGDKLKLSRDITSKENLGEQIVKKTKQKIAGEIDLVNPKQIKTTILKNKGNEIKLIENGVRTGGQEGEQASSSDYLTSSKVTPNIKTEKIVTTDLGLGTIKTVETSSGQVDIIQSGSRKAMVKAKRGETSLQIKKEIGQDIVFGEPKEKDIVKYSKSGTSEKALKRISPPVNRETSSGTETRIEIIRVAPESKGIKLEQAKREAQIQEAKKIFEEIKQDKKQEQMKGLKEGLIELLGKAKKTMTRENKPITFSKVSEGEGIPKMVGGQGLELEQVKLSQEQLTALKEMPTFITVEAPTKMNIPKALNYNIKTDFELGQKSFSKVSTIPSSLLISLNKLKSESKLESKQLNIIQQKDMLKLNQEMKFDLKFDTKLDMKLNQVQLQQLKQEQLQQTKLEQLQQTKQEIQTPREPTQPEPFEDIITDIGLGEPKKKKKTSAKDILGDMFEAVAIIKGKEVKVGEAPTIRGAGEELAINLKSGLQASGFLKSKRTGEKIKAIDVVRNLGTRQLATSKRDIFKVIEPKQFRLGSGKERKDIQVKRRGKTNWLS